MRGLKEPSFEEKVSRRADEIESEAQTRAAEKIRCQQTTERIVADAERQKEARETRERDKRGYSPEEIWGEGSSEAVACTEFLAYLEKHDFPGSKLLTHEPEIPVQPKPKRRWLRKDTVQPVPEGTEDRWSVRGYGIGFTPQRPWAKYERQTIDYETYPYPERHGNVYQDIFLCEDGMIRKFSGNKLSPLDSVNNQQKSDVPRPPETGAVTYHYPYYWGSGQYNVADEKLEDLLVQISTHHTRIQPEAAE